MQHQIQSDLSNPETTAADHKPTLNLVDDSIAEEDKVLSAYHQGWQMFMGLELEVCEGVLVPREETELLGATVISLLQARGNGQRVIDMCCGAGNLTCGVAAGIEDLHLWASDLLEPAAQLTQRNVERTGLASRVVVAQGDLFEGLQGRSLEGTIDVVMCNPPYISTSTLESDRAYLLKHESREAFDGGIYGISIYQRVINEALAYLKPDGWLAFEIGTGQEKLIQLLFQRSKAYTNIRLVHDTNGTPRAALAQKMA